MIQQISSWFLNINQRNTELSFFPSSSWGIVQADVVPDGTSPDEFPLHITFSYIQAFFDAATITVDPILCVWSGKVNPLTGAPIISPVRFAYSGQMVQFKGSLILESGNDVTGKAYQSTVIGNTATTDLSEVYAFGGLS